MEKKNLIVNVPEPKPGILKRGDLFAIAAGNEKLQKMLSELWNGLSMGLKSTEEEYANISQEEHQRIYKAMEKKDADGARKEMEKHIYRSMKDVLTRYQ